MMWSKDKPAEPGDNTPASGHGDKELAAFVGRGVSFKGNITYSGTVRIDGRVEGEVQTDGTLVIGDEAEVRGTIRAHAVVSQGRVTGDIVASQAVKLLRPAALDGTITTPVFSMEEGVLFTGTCIMDNKVRTNGADITPLLVKRIS